MEYVKSAILIMLTKISKKDGKMMDEVEKLLSVWIQDQHQYGGLLSLMLIQEKAKSVYKDLKKKHGEESECASFNMSHAGFISSSLQPTLTM